MRLESILKLVKLDWNVWSTGVFWGTYNRLDYTEIKSIKYGDHIWGNEQICLVYCGVAPRGRSIERPLLINGYAYLAVSLPNNGKVDSNS
jgi:hypothetical protein